MRSAGDGLRRVRDRSSATSVPSRLTTRASPRATRSRTSPPWLRSCLGRHGLYLTLDPPILDAIWAVGSMEIYAKLTRQRGWTRDQWQTWIISTIESLTR